MQTSMNKQQNTNPKPKKTSLPISKLRTDPDTFQFRSRQFYERHVNELTDAIKAGRKLDRMIVLKRSDEDHVVIDGHHRFEAYKRMNVTKSVPVIVHVCDETEAVKLALSENSKTKLPMTKEERQDAAWRLVCSDYGLSKAETAKSTGVSERTVANMRKARKELEELGHPVPEQWWQAIQLRNNLNVLELTEEDREAKIEAEINKLDALIGPTIGEVGNRQCEALAGVIALRLEHHSLNCLIDELSPSKDIDDDFPF